MVSDSLTYYPVLAFVLGGMGAGAVVALAAHLPAFFIYLLLSILPFSARLAAEGGIEHLAMSGMLFVYTIAMLALGRRHHASLLQSLALRFENADLLRTLEQRVEERTQELQDINQRLSRDIAERERAEAALHLQGQRQAALVAFGERALSSADLDAVLKEAAAIAAHGLRVPHTAVLERLANGSALVMRAGVGWPMGVVGCATHATEARALGRGPIGGIRAVEVIVPSGRRPFGVLGAYTAEPRMFSPDDIAFLQSVANTLAAAIQRKRAEDNIHKLALQDPLTGLYCTTVVRQAAASFMRPDP